MKLILLTATALIAAPLAAQTTPAMPDQTTMPAQSTTTTTSDSSTMSTDQSTMPASTDQSTMPAQPAMPAQSTMPADGAMAAQPTPGPMQGSTMTPGGYQPGMPAMQGAMTPGVTPVYKPAPTPAEAYPAPAPLAEYPICKKGQFDKCRNGPRSTHSSEVRGR